MTSLFSNNRYDLYLKKSYLHIYDKFTKQDIHVVDLKISIEKMLLILKSKPITETITLEEFCYRLFLIDEEMLTSDLRKCMWLVKKCYDKYISISNLKSLLLFTNIEYVFEIASTIDTQNLREVELLSIN